jgi:FemAB-related protein (PEP-CTERM system-associated)
MNRDRKSERNRILSDPVAALAASKPDASREETETLARLQQQRRILQAQHRNARIEANVISRNIGIKKRNNEPVDQLIADVQEHSTRIRSIKEKLDNMENRILDFFRLSDSASEAAALPTGISSIGENRASLDEISPLSVTRYSETAAEWNNYVSGNPAASVYHKYEWRDLIEKTFGHESYYFSARDKHRNMVGILPLIRLKSRFFGDFLVSMPYFNYGGALADHPDIDHALMQTANTTADQLGARHIEYRDNIPKEGLPVRSEKVSMILSLPDNAEILWNNFTSKLRAQIKRPQREQHEVLSGGIDYLDDFYEVFSRNMRDLGTPVYGKKFFRNILQTFPDTALIVVIRSQHRPVAAGFLISHGNTLEIPWASSIRDANHLSFNMLLYWEALKYAIVTKHNQFDFGRSTVGSGTYLFKKQWGALPKPLFWHYWLRNETSLPLLNPSNPRFRLMINIWKTLPLFVSNRLGPAIVKNLP